MESKVTEVAPDVYRISTFHPDYQIQFNQFLIKDDEPFLMHTGFRKMFELDACCGRFRDRSGNAPLGWLQPFRAGRMRRVERMVAHRSASAGRLQFCRRHGDAE